MPLPRRAKDWFWRAVVLSPEKPELVPLKSWREQLVNEFRDALRCGTLQSFVASLDKALQAPVINATAETIVTGFLIQHWLYTAAPLCCFEHVALADLLAIVFGNDKFSPCSVARRCQRVHLVQVRNPPIKTVLQRADGSVHLAG